MSEKLKVILKTYWEGSGGIFRKIFENVKIFEMLKFVGNRWWKNFFNFSIIKILRSFRKIRG